MELFVNTNQNAIIFQNNLAKTTQELNLKINGASDDKASALEEKVNLAPQTITDAAAFTVMSSKAKTANTVASTIDRAELFKQHKASALPSIRDIDAAIEAVSLTANQIIQQSTDSLLQQSNQSQVLAMSLL